MVSMGAGLGPGTAPLGTVHPWVCLGKRLLFPLSCSSKSLTIIAQHGSLLVKTDPSAQLRALVCWAPIPPAARDSPYLRELSRTGRRVV